MPFKLGNAAKPKTVAKLQSITKTLTKIPYVTSSNNNVIHGNTNNNAHPTADSNLETVDITKLSIAVAKAETSGCTDGTAIKRHNCHGIMQWNSAGKRSPKYFTSFQESYDAFKKIWAENYKIYPNRKATIRWTGGDKPCIWLRTVDISYFGSSNQKCNDNKKSKNYGKWL